MKMTVKNKINPITLMVASFNSNENTNDIYFGEGFTITECIVRAVDLNFSEDEIRNIVEVYGDDVAGLLEWYLEKGYYLSQPIILSTLKENI